MNLSRALRLTLTSSPLSLAGRGAGGEGAIAFVGAGGKTTAMFQLARELQSSIGNRTPKVIVTVTTHLGKWQIPLADHHVVAETSEEIGELPSGIVLVTGPIEGERTLSVNSSVLSWLYDNRAKSSIPLLVEADGSRQRPLKAPAEHEPPIPEFVEMVVVVAGLSGLGKPLTGEFVFRSERFAELCGAPLQSPVTADMLTCALLHPAGGLKNIPSRARRVCLLNQADAPELQAVGGKIAQELLRGFDSVIVGALPHPTFNVPPSTLNLQTFERVAGIILAAGESKRFGKPKQLLDWRGEPFVRAAAKTALQAGLSPVIVVTGSDAENAEAALAGLDVQIVRNEAWQNGQASSIVSGINALPKNTGACLFLLADQPHITAEVIHALVETYAQSLPAILAPLVREERRANPVLFDQVTFPDLLALRGHVGGRAIFDRYKIEYLPWHDESLLLDVDTPKDYERLRGL